MIDHLEEWWPLYIICAVIMGLLWLMLHFAMLDQAQWERFSSAHECHVVERMSGDVMTTVAPIVGSNGGVAIGVTATPDKTAYLCNDGVKYWR